MTSFLYVILFLITKLSPNVNGQTALVESLPNTAFSASSFWDAEYTAESCKFSSTTCWSPTDNNKDDAWLLIDLGLDYVITSISTIDSAGDHEYVKTYTLNYATNLNTFSSYPSIINANTKRDEQVNNILVPPFIAQYLRFHPETYKTWPSMRVEVFGYIGTLPPTKDPSQSPTVNPTQTTSNPTPAPTNNPTPAPTKNPTNSPTNHPTSSPTQITSNPTSVPTNNPTPAPTNNPTPAPTINPTIYPTTAIPTTIIPTTNLPTTAIPTTTTPTNGEGEHQKSLSTNSEQSSDSFDAKNNNEGSGEFINSIIYSGTALIAFIILVIGLVCCCRIRMQKQIYDVHKTKETNGLDMTVVATESPVTIGGTGHTTLGAIRLSSQSHISTGGMNGIVSYNNGENDEGTDENTDNDSLYEGANNNNNNNINVNVSTPGGNNITPQGPQNDIYDKMNIVTPQLPQNEDDEKEIYQTPENETKQ